MEFGRDEQMGHAGGRKGGRTCNYREGREGGHATTERGGRGGHATTERGGREDMQLQRGEGVFFFWNHFRLRKFPTLSGQRLNSTRSHTPIGSSVAAAEIKHP